jgi:hypothetical protein
MIQPTKRRKICFDVAFHCEYHSNEETDSLGIVTENTCELPVALASTIHIDRLSILPEEILLNIVSFLEPRSMSLTSLAKLNREFYMLMSNIGDSMLQCARSSFRFILPKLDPKESNLSLFIRHVQASDDIKMKCRELKRITQKNFVVPSCFGPIVIKKVKRNAESSEDETKHRDEATSEEIDQALSLAIELVAQDSLSHFLAKGKIRLNQLDPSIVHSSRMNLISCCPKFVENHVMALVGYFSGKVYKYIRTRQAVRSGFEMQSIGREHGDEVFDYILPDEMNASDSYKDMNRIYHARLLMQLAIKQIVKREYSDTVITYL